MSILKYVMCVGCLCMALIPSVSAQSFTLLPDQSEVSFKIKNFGLWVNGTLQGLKVSGSFDPASPAGGNLTATVQTETIDTGIKARNKSLREDTYFDVANHPTLSISSTSISKEGSGYVLKGNLTMKGTTKPIQIPFTVSQESDTWKLSGDFTLNRRDYKVGKGSMVMGNEVKVRLMIVMKK